MADITTIKALKIGVASPEDIRNWSHGEVKKPETINYRTFKPERDGLFCERIFGPTKDWECACGRYKKVKFKGVRCERCGVEVTRARVRRERMGHIELAAPVCHIWYLRGQPPSPLGLLLDMSPRLLEKVIYFTSYIIIDVDRAGLDDEMEEIRRVIDEEKIKLNEEAEIEKQNLDAELEDELANNRDVYTEAQIAERVKQNEARKQIEEKERQQQMEDMDKAFEALTSLQRYQLLDETNWSGLEHLLILASRRLNRDIRSMVKAGLGAAAIRELLHQVDLEKLARELREEIYVTQGPRRARAIKRLEIAESFLQSKTRPEWMILESLPVLPPELRPMVQLDGGRFATSDLNDLYRRIINRNNRLKRIIEIRAPGSIVNHEKRLLQESVDALIDNTRKPKPVPGSHNRPLKSLSDMLKGKEGRFRKNLLGKRVDYSGRSVIVVGPHLKLHQCGLPKEIALELFKPFVMCELTNSGEAQNIKNAKRMIDRQQSEVWLALEKVIKEHPVLLNRAPTLHRLGIQAFEPILVEGKAIQIHPLVCHAYNADFDGDQMAVHVPLSYTAQAEARVLMLSTHNLFSPADGRPIVAPLQDIVLGAYYLTMNSPIPETEPEADSSIADTMFGSIEEAIQAHEAGHIRLHQKIHARLSRMVDEETEEHEIFVVQTTLGRLLFNSILPVKMRFQDKYLQRIYKKKELSNIIREVYKECGHTETVRFLDDLKQIGFTWAMKGGITVAVSDLESPPERHAILEGTMESVRKTQTLYENGEMSYGERRRKVIQEWQGAYDKIADAILAHIGQNNPLYIVTDSGARGSTKQLTQLAGMRGLMTDPFGNFIEDLPILHNFHEGLSVFEYFVSTHGARKGLADTALRTADAGYLTRRLVDIAQDVIIRLEDCGTTEGIGVSRIDREGELLEQLFDRIRGRIALRELKHPYTGDVLIDEKQMFSDELAREISALANELESFTQPLRAMHDKIEELSDEDLIDPQTGEILLEAFTEITLDAIKTLELRRDELRALWEAAGFEWVEHDLIGVPIRTPLGCIARQGICATCYGLDMATQKYVEQGTAVGIIAAQSIGEPGTQLTMRTFHTGGIAGDDIVGVKDVKRQRAAALREIMSSGDNPTKSFTGEELRTLRYEQQRILQQAARRILGRDVKPLLEEFDPATGELMIPSEPVKPVDLPLELPLKDAIGRRLAEDLDLITEDHKPSDMALNKAIGGKLAKELTIKPADRHPDYPTALYKAGENEVMPIGTEITEALVKSLNDKKQKQRVKVLKAAHHIKEGSIITKDLVEGLTDDKIANTIVKLKPETDEEFAQGTVYVEETDEKLKRIVKNWTQKLVKLLETEIGGISRVEELFEARKPKGEAIIAEYEAKVESIEMGRNGKWVVLHANLPVEGDQLSGKLALQSITDEKGAVLVEEMQEITDKMVNRMREAGIERVDVLDLVLVPQRGGLEVKSGDAVGPGDRITPGPLHPDKLLKLRGVRGVQDYMVREIQAVYKAQGVDINDKHIEVIVRQMLKKRRIKDPNDTYFLPGQIVDRFVFEDVNKEAIERGEKPATADWVLLGISDASLQTESFLSAASFQKTTRVLTEAAVKGKIDELVGLKENVIIGRLIPSGTGFPTYKVGIEAEVQRGQGLAVMDKVEEEHPEVDDTKQAILDFEQIAAMGIDDDTEPANGYSSEDPALDDEVEPESEPDTE